MNNALNHVLSSLRSFSDDFFAEYETPVFLVFGFIAAVVATVAIISAKANR